MQEQKKESNTTSYIAMCKQHALKQNKTKLTFINVWRDFD